MKTFLKKILAGALITTLVLSGTLTAFAADQSGIQVQYNGKSLALTEAAKNVDGRIMLPFRQVLESMGATVSYDPATKIITAKTSDRELSFAAGISEIKITKDGAVTSVKSDAAPFVDKSLNRTYVPVRVIAESLGYSVGWDPAAKTVVIIDPATLFANADADFSIISKLMKSDLDLEKPYASTGKFNMNVSTYASPGAILSGMDFSMSGTMTGVQQKSNADMTMTMAFNFDKMLSSLTPEEKTQMQPLLDMFKNASMKMKMNGETGETYMNSSIFTAVDPAVDQNTWYKMNVYDTYQEMGVDMKSLTGMSTSGLKLSELLTASLSASGTMDVNTYEDTKTTYQFLKNLIGDDAFAKKTAGSYTTYTLSLSQASIVAAMAKTALTAGVTVDKLDLSEAADIMNSGTVKADIMVKEKAGSLSGYELKGNCAFDDVSCSFDLAGDQLNAKVNMSFEQKDVMKVTGIVESHVSVASKAPDLSLPADAKIVDCPVY
jgi:hypothetical protein